MKVALINPGKSQRFSVHEPLNLCFIASYLEKHNIDVKIFDELAGQDIEEEINRYKPDIAGITATTTLIPDAYRIAEICKQKKILTVIGGVHATIFPEETLKHADIVVKGEGEIAMLNIVRENIKSGIVTAPYIKNIDEVPPPARHLLQTDYYLKTKDRIPYIIYYAFIPPGKKVASLLTSRGCPYDCVFCHNTWRGMPCRLHSAQRVVSEIEHLIDKYGVESLYFVEDNFFLNKKRTHEICNLIIEKKLNITWGGSTRVDNIDADTVLLAKEAGCRLINFGFESGSQRILDLLKKGVKIPQAENAIRICNEAGIMANGSFMIGNPDETIEDIEKTKEFIKKNKITVPGIYISTPYPGTELWDMAKKRGLIKEGIKWSEFAQERVVYNLSKIPKEKIEKIRAELYLSYFLQHKGEALKLIFMSLRHPRAPFGKIIRTLIPLANVLKIDYFIKFYIGVITIITIFLKSLKFKMGFTVLPYNISWFITWRCNLSCSYCDIGKHNFKELKKEELTFNEIKSIILQLRKIGTRYITFAGGGPIWREDIYDIIAFCKKWGFVVGIVTNGTVIDDIVAQKLALSGVDHIHISLDSADEVQDEIRGVKGTFDNINKGIISLLKYRTVNNFHIGIGSVISKYNIDKLEGLFKYASKMGLDSVSPQPFFRYQMRDKNELNKFAVTNDDIIRISNIINRMYKEYPVLFRNSHFYIKNILKYFKNPKMPGTTCFAGGLTLLIFPSGTVGSCYPLYDEKMKNLKTNTMKSIINSEQFKGIIKRVRKKQCPGCWCAPVHEYNLLYRPNEMLGSVKTIRRVLTGK